jgi:RNA polymerase sigma-B factor
MTATVHRLPVRGPDDGDLVRRHRAGEPHARELMIRRYLPASRRLAARYGRASEPLDDLEQVAALGLVKAVDRWDPERGVPFLTFAAPCIVGELKRYFRDETWTVRPPRPVQELSLAIERTRERLHRQDGREPTVADFAQRLGRAAVEVEEALQANGGRWPRSLDAPPEDEEVSLADRIGAADRGYERAEDRAVIDRLTEGLAARTRLILQLRFEEDLTQNQIGERVGLSQMQVSRTIRSTLRRLGAMAADTSLAA